MVETIQRNGLWHVTLIQNDLIEQAGLNEKDFEYMFTHFLYKDKPVIVSHRFKEHLVVSREGDDNEDLKTLIDGISKVIEYNPFCKYVLLSEGRNNTNQLLTYEWDRVDPHGRWEELSNKINISCLEKLS